MQVFNKKGVLDTERFDPEAHHVLLEAIKYAMMPATLGLRCKIGHLLLALWPTLRESAGWLEAIELGLRSGCTVETVPELIESYVKDTNSQQIFQLHRDEFDKYAVQALEQCDRIESDMGDLVWDAQGKPVGVLPLWVAVLKNASPEDKAGFGPLFDFDEAAGALSRLLASLESEAGPVEPVDVYDSEGRLRLEYFDDNAVSTLEKACERAGGLGYDRIRPVHLLVALLENLDGMADEVVRLQARPGMGPKSVIQEIIQTISLGPAAKSTHLRLSRYHLSHELQNVIRHAGELCLKMRAEPIGERFLLRAVLDAESDTIIGRCLEADPLNLNLEVLLRDVDRRIRDHRLGRSVREARPFLIPSNVAPSEDLTFLAEAGRIEPSVEQNLLIDRIKRGLHKRMNCHVLITGERGVGKTQLVRELARRISLGEIPFLKRKKIVWVNCDGIPPDQSRARFHDIVSAVKGRNDVVLCLDHFEGIVRFTGSNESHNRELIRVALRNGEIHLIAIIEGRYYTEMLSSDHSFLELFTRVEVPEVGVDQTRGIIKKTHTARLEQLYGVRISEEAITRAVRASWEFIMSERQPVKSIKVLREACERVCFEKETNRKRDPDVTDSDVVWAVHERTGIARETIAGTGSRDNFVDRLTESVRGQEQAVKSVADQLQKIKAGATRPGKPAAVFLFAGLTGTGKTELAKAIAQIYSASRRLSVYPMSNFQEAHSISGILGVPPGYVGHESGGRLINDLNADAYGVVLFDEADKAHPDIWQSMLPLFDEAWIEDRRNVKAFGNNAIFILTSNAGQDIIREYYYKRKKHPELEMDLETLKDEVAKKLVEVKNRHGQNVFTPEFLARFTDIIIFNPLDKQAMEGIAELQVSQLVKEWQEKRGKTIIVDPTIPSLIAARSHEENERHKGTKGGRIVAQHVSSMVELKLINCMIHKEDEFRAAKQVRVELNDTGEVCVRMDDPARQQPVLAAKLAERRLRGLVTPGVRMLADSLATELGKAADRWSTQVSGTLEPEQIAQMRKVVTTGQRTLAEKADDFVSTFEEERNRVIATLLEVTPEPKQVEEEQGDGNA